MDRPNEGKIILKNRDGKIAKGCVFFQFLQIYVCHILIFKQPGHILQALESWDGQQKIPKVLCQKDQNLLCGNILEITLSAAFPLHSLQGEGQVRVNQDKQLLNQSTLEPYGVNNLIYIRLFKQAI